MKSVMVHGVGISVLESKDELLNRHKTIDD